MDEQLRERLVEAREQGYKEAIALAKEWLEEGISDYTSNYIVGCSKTEFITAFEADMNKLWEEKK